MIPAVQDRALPTVIVGSSTWDGYDDYHCDGTDDQVEIQQAIDYVNGKGGGVVFLTPGTFNCTDNINLKENVSLFGASRETTKLEMGSNGIVVNNADISSIYRMSINSNNVAIDLYSTSVFLMRDTFAFGVVKITSSSLISMINNATGQVGITSSSYIDIESSVMQYLSGTQPDIVLIDKSQNIKLSNNVVAYGSKAGIFITDSADVQVTGNDISNLGVGIQVQGQGVRIENNVIHDCNTGVILELVPLPTIRPHKGNVVSGNIIYNMSAYGISTRSGYAVVSNNTISDINKDGIRVDADYCVVNNNMITDISKSAYGMYSGIVLNGSNSTTVVGNMIRGDGTYAPAYGIEEINADYNTITGNSIVGVAIHEGVHIVGDHTVAVGNVIK